MELCEKGGLGVVMCKCANQYMMMGRDKIGYYVIKTWVFIVSTKQKIKELVRNRRDFSNVGHQFPINWKYLSLMGWDLVN